MKIPSKLRIVASNYKVEEINGDTDYHGQCKPDDKVLHIQQKLKGDALAGVMFHEIAHAILDQYNVRLKSEIEEKIIYALEHGFMAFAKDHQKVFQEMVKTMGEG